MIVTILCDSADKYLSERFWIEGDTLGEDSPVSLHLPQSHLRRPPCPWRGQTYPHECCGILLGSAKPTVPNLDCSPAANRAGNTRTDSAHNRYHIAPDRTGPGTARRPQAAGLDIVGFYHSHPDHPAQWSATDFAEAHWFGCAYVITEVAQGESRDHQLASCFRRYERKTDKAFVSATGPT